MNMKESNFLKPIVIRIVVLMLSVIILNIVAMLGDVLTDNLVRSVVNVSESLLVTFLYIFSYGKFFKDLSRKRI